MALVWCERRHVYLASLLSIKPAIAIKDTRRLTVDLTVPLQMVKRAIVNDKQGM